MYDICRNCVIVKSGKVSESERVKCHKMGLCVLYRKPNKIHHNKWTCDGINFKSEEKGCLSGMMNDKKKYKFEPWGCGNCNFKLW